MENDEWEKETSRRFGLVAKYFKPKENQTIADFITTATDVSKDEKEAVTVLGSLIKKESES